MGGVPFLPSTSIRLGRLPNALPVLTCLETLNIDVDRVGIQKIVAVFNLDSVLVGRSNGNVGQSYTCTPLKPT